MVISSIDLKDGKVVQLKNGKDTVLERDDALTLIQDFDTYGEVAVIDLDAALGNTDKKGLTANTDILKSLLRRGNVRVGGGIRDVKKAKELISLGAEKVIIGSAAFKVNPPRNDHTDESVCGTAAELQDNEILNTEFLEELVQTIGRQRIIISVDAIEGVIAVKGWKESAGIPLIQGAMTAEKYASELLFTCVEREGCMTGIDMNLVKELRQAVSCRLVVAGGVSSVEEIIQLEKLHCDVQLGMALYTGAVALKDAFIGCVDWEKTNNLVPVIAQSTAGQVLMMGYSNKEALEKTFATGNLTFWSRTRNVLWTKGETSGNTLSVQKLRLDCDRDTILATVVPKGGTCHIGSWTCFSGEKDAESSLERLYAVIADRFANPKPGSYTATLTGDRVREKLMEEAEELTEAEDHEEVVWECADLLYFMSVLMFQEKVTWKEVLDELDRRHKK